MEKLIEIVRQLRDPVKGCPWDKVQTHQSLKNNLLEESYEVLDAIDKSSPVELKEELGDLLLQVVLHSQIADDDNNFNIHDVINYLSEKLVRRHPHVFGEKKAENPDEAIANWEEMKQKEKKQAAINGEWDEKQSILSGVPKNLPALFRAQKVSEKAAKVGFEWDTLTGIRDQILEEISEFTEEAIKQPRDEKRMKDEFGDMFFAMIQLARRLKFDAEDLLQQSTNKFVRRFKKLEQLAGTEKPLTEFTLDEFDKLWKESKKQVG